MNTNHKKLNATQSCFVLLTIFILVFSVNIIMPYATEDNPLHHEGVSVIPDVNSPTGYTAVFIFKDDAASLVQVASGMFNFARVETGAEVVFSPHEWESDMFAIGAETYKEDMTYLGDGLWKASLPLPSGAYPYYYLVTYPDDLTDAEPTQMTDPANPHLIHSITGKETISSMLYMPFDSEKQTYDFSNGMPREDKKGSIITEVYTDYQGIERSIALYLPYAYDENRETPYKVQFVSHGLGGFELEWLHEGNIPNMLDNLIANNAVEPYIVVSVDNQALGEYLNWPRDEIQNVLFKSLIPYIEENYNVTKDPSGRAYSGFSMGGRTTTWVYLDNPTEFGYFGIWSGSWIEELEGKENLDVPTVMLTAGMYDFGLTMPGFGVQLFADALDEMAISYNGLYIYPGAHDWFVWHRSFEVFVTDYLWKSEESIRFEDVSGWYSDAIHYLADKGIVNGVTASEFMPNAFITRAQVVQILANMAHADLKDYTSVSFNDVDDSDWFMPAIAWAQNYNLIQGIGSNQFAPESQITRQDLSVILSNYIDLMTDLQLEAVVDTGFEDDNAINDYALNSVQHLHQAGIINGKPGNFFSPKDPATRGETATMIARLVKALLNN